MISASSRQWVRCVRLLVFVGVAIVGIAPNRPLSAQATDRLLSFDFGTGGYHGLGAGPRSARSGVSIATALSARIKSGARHKLLISLNASAFYGEDSEQCVVTENGKSDPTNSCLSEFPSTAAVGLLLGFEQRLSHAVSVRVLAGPSQYATFFPRVEGARPGFLSRVDLVVPTFSSVAFVLWGELGVIPYKATHSGLPSTGSSGSALTTQTVKSTGTALLLGVGLRVH